ncbi:hypothetical protein [Nocardia stercoris]|uniref:DUF3263 domain-containing protein n=1 Tax=Nocardia stercoris TaxID=2483361 RepID=A0A3M2L6J1_9NOCA|nr:hypothetical protein [Nocardia stercoris]RMI30148.1 hypothetical protein EBN03_23285 [Nocardia stercoris]
MTPHENDILEFATAWLPYGGNDDEIFVLFGIDIAEFHRRLLALLDSRVSGGLSNITRAALREQCVDRLRELTAQAARRTVGGAVSPATAAPRRAPHTAGQPGQRRLETSTR